MQSTIVVLLYFCVAVVGGGGFKWLEYKTKTIELILSCGRERLQSEVSGSVPRGSEGSSVRWIRFI